jgi:glycosyltransferase involved in cell wall biosynthesis
MRILFYQTIEKGTSGKGGWSHIFELLDNLSRLEHSIILVDGQNYSPVEESDIGLNLEQRQSLWERTKAFVMTLPFRGEAMLLWNLLKEVRLFLVALGTALRHKPDLVYRRHSIFNAECVLAKLFKVPLIEEVNGIVVDEAKTSGRASRFSLRIIDRIERLNLRQADKIIVVTSKLKDLLRNDYKILEDKIVVIKNGANTKLFQPMDTTKARKELNLSQSNNYICFVGLLWQVQGVEYLIKVMPRILEECPNTQLLIVGYGPTKDELVKLAKGIGVSDWIIFTGMVSYNKVPLYINASNICVAPFIRERNEKSGVSPLKIYEYAACEKAIVTSKLPGLEFIEQHKLGILVEPDSPDELAAAIMKLLREPELRRQMGENGRKYVVKDHSWESVARKVAEVCEQAIEERKRQQNEEKK